MSEIRYNYLEDEYVIFAPERARRPIENVCSIKDDIKTCPFCPGREGETTKTIFELRDKNGWKVRVFPNLFRVFSIETPPFVKVTDEKEVYGGFGAHEIIVETPFHEREIYDRSIEELNDYVNVIYKRVTDLKKDKRISLIQVFKNKGAMAGASLVHPHTQIIASHIVSKKRLNLIKRNVKTYKKEGVSLLKKEFQSEKLIVFENNDFKAVVPFASFYPFEIIIYDKDFRNFYDYDESRISSFCSAFSEIMKRMKKTLGNFDFNLEFYIPLANENFQTETFFQEIEKTEGFYLRIMPRLFFLAGYELSTGERINPFLPEDVLGALNGS